MFEYYKINYNWGYKQWKLSDDVLLEAIVTSDITIAEKKLIQWLNHLEKGTTSVDKQNITCWYYGGVWLYYAKNENSIFIYMHSSGEDAFDSLAYCANKIAKILYQNHTATEIKWIEHPHRRKYLKETTKFYK
ncbi:hypothetical protein Q4R59_17000 [Morganella morganii]|uniref:hypothetical protein n=1 Tax=Morganella morganii TaxID=582 RepID=UPI000F82ADB8|nr:hypothetical protein [Morganella morganii]RTY28219.1 hypothetical protein EKS33_15840 [Morganella morganii subsp. morganii]WLV38457.1 hypothetical protein M2O45_15495 [Morganella morganii]HEI8451795.1 hypothetical protein [Morganella morganii]HEI8861029.1 hypothetical protein [Morganella morganii]